MARKPAVSLETLVALGVDRLAELVLEGIGRDAAFKKRVAAALAGAKGGGALTALLDRRLAALERARGTIDWNREKEFAADLQALVTSIADELGKSEPGEAIKRLIRFVTTHPSVFERIDDSGGRIQGVYDGAVDMLPTLAATASPEALTEVADLLAPALSRDTHGYVVNILAGLAQFMPLVALKTLDGELVTLQRELAVGASSARKSPGDWEGGWRASLVIRCRQHIAIAWGDLDAYIALEEGKPVHAQDAQTVAEMLLQADRPREALDWIRKSGKPRLNFMIYADVADGVLPRDAAAVTRVLLEGKILDRLGEPQQAQDVRWSHFAETLNATILRDYMARLPDFEEFDALDRAFAHVSGSKAIYAALVFFLEWSDLARAAKLVIDRKSEWSGRHYNLLTPAAEQLEEISPVASAFLYRTLLLDILARGNSVAYGHGARYLAKLDHLADAFDAGVAPDCDNHAAFLARLRKDHARKSGFWAAVAKIAR